MKHAIRRRKILRLHRIDRNCHNNRLGADIMAPANQLDETSPLLGAESSGSSAVDMAAERELESGTKQIQSHTEPAASSSFWEPHTDPQGGSSTLDENDFVTVKEDRDLRRGLHQRHVSLIAIAGAVVRSPRHTFKSFSKFN